MSPTRACLACLAIALLLPLSACGADPDGPADPGETTPLPTGGITLMALGTHDSYATPDAGPFALVIISPEQKPGAALARARDGQPGVLVLAYLNTMDIMLSRAAQPDSFWDAREDWFLHDESAARVRVRIGSYQGELVALRDERGAAGVPSLPGRPGGGTAGGWLRRATATT